MASKSFTFLFWPKFVQGKGIKSSIIGLEIINTEKVLF